MTDYAVDMDVVRRCMLRGSATSDMDMLGVVSPVQRCMLVAKAVHNTRVISRQMNSLIESSEIINALIQEATKRRDGPHGAPTLYPETYSPTKRALVPQGS